MTQERTFTFPSSDGTHEIFAREWLPEGKVRGVVQIVHGVGEHMGRYDRFARFLNEHGFAVYGEDHLGHGMTQSPRGWFAEQDGWQLAVRDVRRLRELAGEKHPGVPYIMLGHSMGSFLARTYLIDYPGTLDGVILSGTGQERAPLIAAGKVIAGLVGAVKGTKYRSKLVYALSMGSYNKKFAPARTTADWISRDEGVVDLYVADPLRTSATVGLFRDMMGGLQYIAKPANLAKMDKDTPVYFFSGDRDPVGDMGHGVRKVYDMFKRAGSRDVEIKLYEGGRHEMLNELDYAKVQQDVLVWIERHI